MNLHFTNLNSIPMTAYAPLWQTEIIKRVSEEYSEQARECNRNFRDAVLEKIQNENCLAGQIVNEIERNTPRYAYIKNIKDDHGNEYDAQIDLLLCAVQFIQI